MYPIVQVPEHASETPEQVGSKYKFWYDNQTQMFKLAREGTGEDWAEKIACELARLIELPHAHYELATWRDKRGATTANMALPPRRLVLGNELLASFVPNYPGGQTYRQRQHTIGRVLAVVSAANLQVPLDVPPEMTLTPLEIFVGYLLLDAWIGNTDRHHENWGIVVSGSNVHLSPTFDHASSLGRELSDAVRLDRLSTRDERRGVRAYIAKARSALYRTENDPQPLSTLDAFREFAKRCPSGKEHWLGKLKQLSDNDLQQIIDEMPLESMSPPARQFARAILLQNRDNLIACSDAP